MIRATAISLLLAFGCAAPQPTRLDQVHALVQSPDYAFESVLWLRALGTPATVADCDGKLTDLLHLDARAPDGDCRFAVDGPFARAVLVSRTLHDQLPEIRSLLDTEALEAYVLWSERPERVGFEQTDRGIRIDANPGPNDLILVRVPFSDGWTADAPVTADPVGYVVVHPAQPGRQSFELRSLAPPPTPPLWSMAEIPRIQPGGISQPGQRFLVVFGERFTPTLTHAIVDDVRIAGGFSNHSQLNVQLPIEIEPGPHKLRVETPSGISRPVEFELEQETRP